MQQAIIDNQNFVYYLFNLTAGSLVGLSYLTNLSYQFWNIVIWFGIIPATWIYLIGRKTTAWLNLISLALFIYLFAIHSWTSWFNQAVVLLYQIGKWIHADYKVTSVIVCVFVTLLVHFIVIGLCTSRKTFRKFAISTAVLSALVVVFFPVSNWLIPYYVR